MDTKASGNRGSEIDRNAIFSVLYDLWMAAGKGRNGRALSEMLETRKQTVSGYRTGNDGRIPPWWVLLRMLDSLRMELRVTADGSVLTKRRGRAPQDPTTKKGDQLFAFKQEAQ